MAYTVVIVGGDAAGMSAASKVKRERPETEVIVYEQSADISYAACGIPYWLSGVVDSEEALKALTLEQARHDRGIDVRIEQRVEAVDRQSRQVLVRDLKSDTPYTQSYDKLMLATGASAILPPLPGLELPGVFTLRSLADGRQIHAYLQHHNPRRAVIVGGGYVGLEMAESFRARGMETWVVEMLDQIMPNMDPELLEPVVKNLETHGVHLHTGTRLTQISAQGGSLLAETAGAAASIATDLVLVSVGVRPNSELARDAGLRLGVNDAVWVDEQLRTSDPHIYAAGDCAQVHHLVLDQPVWIPLAPAANKGGRIVGENLAGTPSRFPGVLGSAVVKVFDFSLAVTGLTEKVAREHAQRFVGGIATSTIQAGSRPEYYPGHEPISVKLVLEQATGRLLGAQLVSRADISKRADVLAVAITAGMTVDQIGLLDLTYAPPYAPVYDPVLVAANVATRQVG